MVPARNHSLRGGAQEPLTRHDIEDKFALNARHGGWPQTRTASALARAKSLYDGPLDLRALRA